MIPEAEPRLINIGESIYQIIVDGRHVGDVIRNYATWTAHTRPGDTEDCLAVTARTRTAAVIGLVRLKGWDQ